MCFIKIQRNKSPNDVNTHDKMHFIEIYRPQIENSIDWNIAATVVVSVVVNDWADFFLSAQPHLIPAQMRAHTRV